MLGSWSSKKRHWNVSSKTRDANSKRKTSVGCSKIHLLGAENICTRVSKVSFMIKLTDEWISAPCFYWSVIHVNRNRLIHSGLNPPLVSYCFGIFGLMMLSLIETILVTYLMARDDKVKDQSPREDSNQQDESRRGTYDNMDKSFNYRQNDPEMRSTLSTHTIWRQSVVHNVSFQTWRDGLRAIVTCLLTKRYLRHVFHSIISSLSSHSLVHMFLLQLMTKKN